MLQINNINLSTDQLKALADKKEVTVVVKIEQAKNGPQVTDDCILKGVFVYPKPVEGRHSYAEFYNKVTGKNVYRVIPYPVNSTVEVTIPGDCKGNGYCVHDMACMPDILHLTVVKCEVKRVQSIPYDDYLQDAWKWAWDDEDCLVIKELFDAEHGPGAWKLDPYVCLVTVKNNH